MRLAQQVVLKERVFTIVGVMQQVGSEDKRLAALVPYTVLDLVAEPTAQGGTPMIVVRARAVEEVAALQAEVEQWLRAHVGVPGKSYEIQTSAADQLEQARQGILVFKLALGHLRGHRPAGWRHRDHECAALGGARADEGDRHPEGGRCDAG